MSKFFGPVIGIGLGVLIIIFRNYLRCFVENLYNKLPKYEDGVKAFNIKYSIRPIFFGALGLIIIVFSIAGIIIQLD